MRHDVDFLSRVSLREAEEIDMNDAATAATSHSRETALGLTGKGNLRSLLAACLAHALHDGYTDGLYAFMPVWQAQFGLSYAVLAVVRALYFGTMGACRSQPTGFFADCRRVQR